jgi:isopentenyl-diphosphate delta-isomerase
VYFYLNQGSILDIDKTENISSTEDQQARSRKKDHIALAFKSATTGSERDRRFYYEPMLSNHPNQDTDISIKFLGHKLNSPIWVSSMTGGTQWARTINHRLAAASAHFGMGMGLGSCRQLLFSDEHLDDFAVRRIIGEQPLYANLGIAQVEQLLEQNHLDKIAELLKKLEANGLIVHVNPLQEWLQPEGDRILYRPVDTLKQLLDVADYPVVVKEVGQGFGPNSLQELMNLPLAAIDFGAQGGTNFSRLEMLRGSESNRTAYDQIALIGHNAEEMVEWVNDIHSALKHNLICRQFIISGGVGNFLDGYYLTNKLTFPAIYGQASAFLRYAQESEEALFGYIEKQVDGLKLAHKYLRIR